MKRIFASGVNAFLFSILPVLTNAQNAIVPGKSRHFVVRVNPLRFAQNAFYNRSSQRSFPELTGISIEVSPVKFFSIEFEPGMTQLKSLIRFSGFEYGWGMDAIEPTQSWSPTGRIAGRIYPFTLYKCSPTRVFEGLSLGFIFGYGEWKFNFLDIYYRRTEHTPNGNEYSFTYYHHKNGVISRKSYMGSIAYNFTLDKNHRMNLGLYLNPGVVRYTINSELKTITSPTVIWESSENTQSIVSMR